MALAGSITSARIGFDIFDKRASRQRTRLLGPSMSLPLLDQRKISERVWTANPVNHYKL
jgi:hypothetical protein